MTEANYMAQFGARLIANGYSILPIAPGTKKPGRYRSGAWGEFPGWPQYGERCPTDLEVVTWSKWPGAGIGVVCGSVAAVDIDIVVDPDLALKTERLCREHLGDSPALRIGRAPKRLLVYRAATPFKGIKRHPLEVLCAGQQFVAYATHPDTGTPYVWPEEGLADLDIDSLPEITEEQAHAFLEAAMELIPERLRPVRLETGANDKPASGLAQQGTAPAIKSALAWLPNADLDYDSWMRIGMALKGALGEAGADLFATWSAQAGKNEPAFTDKSWASFNPTSIGAGTIYHMAMERGWKPDAALVLDGSVKADPAHPAAGLLAAMSGDDAGETEESDKPSQITVPPAPSPDRLDGVLKLMVDHIVATAIRPQPWLALGASLTALGALMGRKVRTESNLRSNLNVVGIAESGGGKDHARKAIKEIFTQAGFEAHLGGERIASGAGLISALTRQPSSLFQIDEFGRFMANVVDKRRAPKHLSEIWDLFTELATSAGTTFMGAEYADQKERPRQDIIEPCTSVHGVSAPGPFWDALSSGSLQDGSLARFLVFRSEDDIPDRNRRPAPLSELPRSLLKGVKAVAAVGSKSRGNLAQIGSATVRPDPVMVPMNPEALMIFDALDEEMTARQRAALGTDQGAVLARVWENTAKIALIKAVSANPRAPVIRGEDAKWARDLVAHCVGTLVVQAERHIADTDSERNHKRILEIIRKAGKKGIKQRDLTRKCQFLDPKTRRETLQSLLESEQVTGFKVKGSGRPAQFHRVTSGGL